MAADRVAPRLPTTGWLIRALDTGPTFVDSATLLADWPS